MYEKTSSLRTLKIMPRNLNEIVRSWIWFLVYFLHTWKILLSVTRTKKTHWKRFLKWTDTRIFCSKIYFGDSVTRFLLKICSFISIVSVPYNRKFDVFLLNQGYIFIYCSISSLAGHRWEESLLLAASFLAITYDNRTYSIIFYYIPTV